MKTLILIAALTVSATSFAEDSFKLEIRPEGDYKLAIHQTFKKEVALNDIFVKGYFDSNIQQKSDPVVWKFVTTPSMKDLVAKGGGAFKLEILFGKSFSFIHLKKTVISDCTLNANQMNLRAVCKMDMEDGRSHMEFSCSTNSDNSKSCSVATSGFTKRIKYIKLIRSAPELAVSGSNVTIKGMFKAKHVLEGGNLNEVDKDIFYSRNVAPFFKESNEHFDDHYIENPLTIMSSPAGLKYK